MLIVKIKNILVIDLKGLIINLKELIIDLKGLNAR